MIRSLLVLVALAGPAAADKATTSAASTWLAGMTGSGAPPALKHPLAFTVHSDRAECAKLARGMARSAAELAALKACFVATWAHVAKEATLVVEDIKQKDLDGDQLRFHRGAPKGTTWVRASRSYAGQDLAIRLALGADHAVLAVWFVYQEHDGE